MNQSFVSHQYSRAKILALRQCGVKFVVKTLLKAPPPPANNKEKQQREVVLMKNKYDGSEGGGLKNSGEVLSKLKCRGFRATSLSTYDFSTLYTTLPYNLIKEKLLDLIEWTFKRALKNYGSLYLACNDRKAFFTSSDQSRYTLWSCQNVCDALSYLLDNIYIRFGTKLYRQIVGIPMGTNCAPLVADLFLYCYERDFMDSLNHDNQADVIEASM